MSTSTPRPDDDETSPVTMAEVQGTDAVLNRLAAGTPSQADREDPLLAMLAGFVAEVRDGEADAPAPLLNETGRLSDVLGRRPLWVVPMDEQAPGGDAGLAAAGMIDLNDPSWPPKSRVIDLTGRQPDRTAAQEAAGESLTGAPGDPGETWESTAPTAEIPAQPMAGRSRGARAAGTAEPGQVEPEAARPPVKPPLLPAARTGAGRPRSKPLPVRPVRPARPAGGRPGGPRIAGHPTPHRLVAGSAPPEAGAVDRDDTVPGERLRELRARRLARNLRELPVPIALAALVAVLALGGGVTAAVNGGSGSGVQRPPAGQTGTPDTPLSRAALASAQLNLARANRLLSNHKLSPKQYQDAYRYLRMAQRDLAKVPGGREMPVGRQINRLAAAFATVPHPTGSAPVTVPTTLPTAPVPSVPVMPEPTVVATPSSTPSTVTVSPTPEPTVTQPSPSATGASPTASEPPPPQPSVTGDALLP